MWPGCRAALARRATLAQSVEQLIRNQQVVGSNPTGGSKKSKKFNDIFGHFDFQPVELSWIVRKLSEFVKGVRQGIVRFSRVAGPRRARPMRGGA